MSTISVSNITDGTDTVGTSYVVNGSAKAWCHFNGTGTVAISDSFSTSSLTDVSTGQYKTDWTNSFSNSEYACSALSWQLCRWQSQATGFVEVISAPYYGAAHADGSDIHTIAFGDLA